MHGAYFVYILECGDGTLYTGYTTDIERRLEEHRAGNGAKYTRGREPIQLLYAEPHSSRSSALKREAAIKRLSRPEKLEIASKGSEHA